MVDIREIARAWLKVQIDAGRLTPELDAVELVVIASTLLRANGPALRKRRTAAGSVAAVKEVGRVIGAIQ